MKRKITVPAILLVAAGMIAYGSCRGETAIILNKAVNICMQCIGLG
ncbi:MAG: thioredoxin [Lachnospiraceae bacterium]|nr:thioredoxin [Lachnospiraceae bacterium]